MSDRILTPAEIAERGAAEAERAGRALELSGLDLDQAVGGYFDALLWLQSDNERDANGGVRLGENYDVDDIDEGAREDVRDEIAAFASTHPLAVRMFLAVSGDRAGYERSDLFGHDFYLTREGHGAGFWDRGLGELGDYLTTIAKGYGGAAELTDGEHLGGDRRTFDEGTLYA